MNALLFKIDNEQNNYLKRPLFMNGDLVDEHSVCTIPARQAKKENGVSVHILHIDHLVHLSLCSH